MNNQPNLIPPLTGTPCPSSVRSPHNRLSWLVLLSLLTVLRLAAPAQGQSFILDCSCLASQSALTTNACQAVIPDLCQFTNCWYGTVVPVPLMCNQTPPAGTPVGPGVWPITLTITDTNGVSQSCYPVFTVQAPADGCNTNPCVPPPPGLVGWWPLDELTGAPTYAEVTGNGHLALVESGGPVGSSGSPAAVAGKVAGAGQFFTPLTRGRVTNAPALNFGTNSFSVDGWVYPMEPALFARHPILDKLDLTSLTTGEGYAVSVFNVAQADPRVQLRVGDGGPIATYTSLGSPTYWAWNFVAVTVDRVAGTVVFHLNGVSEPPQPLLPAGSFDSSVDLLIGGNYNAAELYGRVQLDEIELFNTALSSADAAAIWLADAAGKCRPCTNSPVEVFCPPATNVFTCGSNAVVTWTATATNHTGPVTCTPPSGSVFPLGTNLVTCVATNACSTNTCTFTVTVLPATATWTWARQGGGPLDDSGLAIARHSSGDLFVAGRFEGPAVFGPFSLTNAGGHDIFVARLTGAGNFLWVTNAGGSGSDWGKGIAVDAAGNSYVVGATDGNATFGSLTLAGGGGFVAKLNSAGNFLWVTNAGWDARAVALNAAGTLVQVAGQFGGTTAFGPTNLTSAGGVDVFVSRLTAAGAFQWTAAAGGPGSDVGRAVAVNATGETLLTGAFGGSGTTNPASATFGPFTLTTAGDSDAFFAKLDASGQFLWATNGGGTSVDEGAAIAVDAGGRVYAAGDFKMGPATNTATFGPHTVFTTGLQNIFVVKLDASGQFLWATNAGGGYFDFARGLALDALGHPHVTGITWNGIFDGTPLFGYGGSDIFVTRLDPAGNFLWVTNAGGLGDDNGEALTVDPAGCLYVTGLFSPTLAHFPPAGTLTNAGMTDVFVAKLCPPCPLPPLTGPAIVIVPVNLTNVLISWTSAVPGFMLQENLTLNPAGWTNAPSGETNPVVVPASLPTRFYRLFKP